jgi:hypothetical protein
MITNANQPSKSVADPCAAYDSVKDLWRRSRAVCSGERYVKDLDSFCDTTFFTNLLLPFSPSMSQSQYDFYKAEAELPGIVSQHARIIVGGLLRKQPQLKLPEGVPAEAVDWIMTQFTQNNDSLVSFLDRALWEEMQTSRAWVYVDYPVVPNASNLSKEDFKQMKPYPVLWKAESIVNWKLGTDGVSGVQTLEQVIVRDYELVYKDNEFHPEYLDTVWVHEVVEGYYQIRKFQKSQQDAQVTVVNGVVTQNYQQGGANAHIISYELVDTNTNILMNGERMREIPAWPLNGSVEITEPMLLPIIDREVSLYNKISRRNHLLYGASTYTPIISSDMTDEDFQDTVNAGLGSWIHLHQGDSASVLNTPTEALKDMDRAISNTIEEIAKLGIRMLTPESAQSGVALEIRNAAQTAQLGTLNVKVSNQLAGIITFMLNWRYDLQLKNSDIFFELSADFNPAPLGADWLRLATEWYQGGLIPRSTWLQMLTQNDMLSPDYDDEAGQEEITQDNITNPQSNVDYSKIQQMAKG